MARELAQVTERDERRYPACAFFFSVPLRRLLLLLIAACSSSEAIQRRQECVPSVSKQLTPVLLVGQPAQVTLTLDLPCQTSTRATSAQTSVDGPDNLPVEHTATEPVGDSLVVSFTPQRAGPYHLTAKLQPNVGIVQLDVIAALDATQVPVEHSMPRSDCWHLEVTSSGAVLCTNGADVYVARGGTQVQGISGTMFAVRGDDVWVLGPSEATRWHDDGSGPLEPVLPTLTLLKPPRLGIAAADGLVVVSDSDVRRYVLSGSAFTSVGAWTYPAGSPVLAAYDGSELLLRTDQRSCRSSGADAGMLVCVNQTEPLLGASEGGLWIRAGRNAAALWLPGLHGADVQLDAPPATYWVEGGQQGTGPYLSDSPYTLSWQDGAPVFAKWSSVPFERIDGWVVFRAGAGFELRRSSVR